MLVDGGVAKPHDGDGDEDCDDDGDQQTGKEARDECNRIITDAAQAGGYRLPDFSKPSRYLAMERNVRENPDKYVIGVFPHFLFMQMLDLFGFENLMFALIDHREAVERLADRMTESCLTFVDCMAARGADGVIAVAKDRR